MPYLKIAEMKPAWIASPTMIAMGKKAMMKSAVSMVDSVRVMEGMLRAVCDVTSRMNYVCSLSGDEFQQALGHYARWPNDPVPQVDQERQFPAAHRMSWQRLGCLYMVGAAPSIPK